MLDDHAQHIAGLCAERHAHADLVCTLRDRITHHAVNADCRQQQCHAGKYAEQQQAELRRRERTVEQFANVANITNRLIGVEPAHLFSDCCCQRSRLTFGLHGEHQRIAIPFAAKLVQRRVDIRWRRQIQAAAFDIGDDADDQAADGTIPRRQRVGRQQIVGRPHPDGLANRVVGGEKASRQRLVDDGNGLRILVVLRRKCAALAHTNAEGAKVI